MWLVYRNRKARRTGIWADGDFANLRSPPDPTALAEGLTRRLMGKRPSAQAEADIRIYVCRPMNGEIPESSFDEDLYVHNYEYYLQFIFTMPYKNSSQTAARIKQTLKRCGFRSAKGYKNYERFKAECEEILDKATCFYMNPLEVTKEYLTGRKISPLVVR